MRTTTAIRRAVLAARFFLVGVCTLASGCVGMSPSVYGPLTSPQTLGRDWHKHFDYGVTLLEQEMPNGEHKDNGMVFARAAFASAARFSRDYAPAYAGLGLTNLQLGYLTDAEEAFLNAGLMEDRSLYWALASLAALQQGDERLALAAFHLMQQAKIQDEDPVTHFVRGIYAVNGSQFNTPLVSVPLRPPAAPEDADIVCQDDSKEAQCRNLNVVVSVYFVRRSTSDTITRGTNFFNDLKLQLGAEGSISRATGDAESIISRSATLTIPDIQYAVRLTPMDSRTNLYLTAAPSVVTSIGKTSEIHQGSNLTILYNSEGYTNDYTAETGISLRIQPEEASSDAVKLLLDFELSSVAGLAPSMTAQVLNVSSNKYSIEGFSPTAGRWCSAPFPAAPTSRREMGRWACAACHCSATPSVTPRKIPTVPTRWCWVIWKNRLLFVAPTNSNCWTCCVAAGYPSAPSAA